jgi:CCR4-NOT transcription complex subunit 4
MLATHSSLAGRLKRLQAAKKLRDKKRKEEAANVKNLASVRVRQRAQVHIQGMTTKIANEDVRFRLLNSFEIETGLTTSARRQSRN